MNELEDIFWLLVATGALVILQRGLHYEIQAVLLITTRRADISQVLFSILFLPGILMHELSHYVMAKLLRVRTGRISIVPRPLADRRLQLGFVETGKSDIVRDAIIGAAPLLSGGLLVAYIGLRKLDLLTIWGEYINGNNNDWSQMFQNIYQKPDFWLWIYLIFTVSSTMLPSRSDRKAWLPIMLILSTLYLMSVLIGAGPWLMVNVAPYIHWVLWSLTIVFSISIIIHFCFWVPSMILRILMQKFTGLKVV